MVKPMRILHVLANGEMGWSGGIRPTLRSLSESPLASHYHFALACSNELQTRMQELNPDLLVWHGACSWRELPRLHAHRRRRQILFEHHYCKGFEQHNVPSQLRFHTMLRLSYAAMDRVAAVSMAQGQWMTEARLVEPSRACVLRSARPVDLFLTVPAPPLTQNRPFTFLAYGRFTPQKGFDTLLRAIRLLSATNMKLLLAGDGPEAEPLKAQADDDPRIEWLGPRRDIPALMDRADAVVIPSRWEPWGNVCLEARAAGRPVVVSGADGLPEQVQGCGVVTQGDAPSDLAGSLESILTATPVQRQAWSIAGRLSAQGAWREYLDGWSRLLDSVG